MNVFEDNACTVTELNADLRSPKPKVSIVIPVLNQREMTVQCLKGLAAHTPEGVCEIIVVNNGSTDGTQEYLDSQPNVRAIHLDSNAGVGPAWNIGIRESKGDYVCVINNDIVVTPGWLEALLWPFEHEPLVWCTGPIFTRLEKPPRFDDLARRVAASEPLLVSGGIIGFCFMLSREAIEHLGEFDERFETAWFEDTDYYMRLLHAGHPPALATNCLIHHYETRTARKELTDTVSIIQRNAKRFVTKWGRLIDPGTDTGYVLDGEILIARTPAQGTQVDEVQRAL